MKTLDQLSVVGLENQTASPHQYFTLRNTVIQHPYFCESVREIAKLHLLKRNGHTDGGLVLVAQSGTGKSTLLETYEKHFPRSVDGGMTTIPVLRVVTPEAPSVKAFTQQILFAMGDRDNSNTNTTKKTQRIATLFKSCGVELLLVDEFQHFFEGRRKAEGNRVADWLKNLLNETKIAVVLAGLPRSTEVLSFNPSLKRRCGTPFYFQPFGYTAESEQLHFRAVLKGLQTRLPLESVDLFERNLARRFYFASNGLLDYVVRILDEAVQSSHLYGTTKLDLESFEQAFVARIWKAAPKNLNPFSKKFVYRQLMQPGEPFCNWEDAEKRGLRRANAGKNELGLRKAA